MHVRAHHGLPGDSGRCWSRRGVGLYQCASDVSDKIPQSGLLFRRNIEDAGDVTARNDQRVIRRDRGSHR
jgi:hypothetical protein